MKQYQHISLFVVLCIFFCAGKSLAQHPCIYVSSSDKELVRMKAEALPWGSTIFNRLKQKIEVYANRHQTDPEWIISRLSMYWKEGERYTQCYMKNQNWDRGEGNAPVPTVRMPGMRTWNKYVNVPLEDRIPYNETGDMWGIDRQNPSAPRVKVPYKESGHMIRSNNVEILTIGEESAFLYWLTGKDKYARLASDIFQIWLMGTYYMNPIKDPDKSSGGLGGWEPGGICGYYDYEQIHDDLAMHAAIIYDFVYDYLIQHPCEHLQQIGKSIPEISAIVFKRFIDLGMIRGGKSGNWNVNGWNMILRPILALESNEVYEDGRGREYYLHYLLKETTPYHEAIPDMLKSYNSVTGLWPESPGYSFGTVQMLLEWAILLKRAGYDIIADNPILEKAAMAVFPWMDESGNLVVFGDYRGGRADYQMFENLLSYYAVIEDDKEDGRVVSALRQGLDSGKYDRGMSSWIGLCTYLPNIPSGKAMQNERTSYSVHHRFITMKNWSGNYKMMANLYGGTNGSHLTPNGLALQLYAYGYALVPDASAYESYWSKDYNYHQSVTGANTILPGYMAGDIVVEAMEPMVDSCAFVNSEALTPYLNFADVSAAEKRRMVVMIKTSEQSGYYIDIFRSDLEDNDYLFHHVGDKMLITDKQGKLLSIKQIDSIGKIYHEGYRWFENLKKCDYEDDFRVEWSMPEHIVSRLWFVGEKGRTLFQMEAPSSTLNEGLTPGNCSMVPFSTPTLLVRQAKNNAAKNPFISVYESFKDDSLVTDVKKIFAKQNCVGLEVSLHKGRMDYLLSATDTLLYRLEDKKIFSGALGHIAKCQGEIESLYLGKGKILQVGKYKLESLGDSPIYMAIYKQQGIWYYSSTGKGKITIEGKTRIVGKSIDCRFEEM